MKQIKFLGVLAVALTLGLAACDGGGKGNGDAQWESDKTNHWHIVDGEQADKARHTFEESADESVAATCTVDGKKVEVCSVCGYKKETTIKASHKWGQWQTVTAATCQAEGSEKRVCSVCQNEETRAVAKTDHSWGEWISVSEPTCTEAGSHKHICSVCQTEELEEIPANGHTWVAAEDQSAAIAPTCTEAGTQIEECSVCHAKQEVAVEALGHDFPAEGRELEIPGPEEKNTKGEIPFHWAKITNYSCTRGDSYRYAWSAKEVNFDYKNVAEGAEPELLDEGEDGIRFWGRPIGNAMELDENGTASGNDAVKIPDESVKGSRFEFDFVFDTDVNDVCLSADLQPAQYTNDIFKNRSGDQEWTPGYRFKDVTDPETGETTREAEMIEGMRYIIYLDGVEVPLDNSVNTRPNGRRWYQFPCKLNLTAGKHNLNIAMAGGYRHTFYSFSFEKVAPAHEHNLRAGAKDGVVIPETCTCGMKAYRLDIADATGFNTPNTKWNAKDGVSAKWDITGKVPAGNYQVMVSAKTTSSSHSNRYWYNQYQTDSGTNADKESEDPFRYYFKLDGGDNINPTVTKTWGEQGLTNTEFNWVEVVASVTFTAESASFEMFHGNIGYSLFVESVRLVVIA